jgi:hypothetical protein
VGALSEVWGPCPRRGPGTEPLGWRPRAEAILLNRFEIISLYCIVRAIAHTLLQFSMKQSIVVAVTHLGFEKGGVSLIPSPYPPPPLSLLPQPFHHLPSSLSLHFLALARRRSYHWCTVPSGDEGMRLTREEWQWGVKGNKKSRGKAPGKGRRGPPSKGRLERKGECCFQSPGRS